MCQSHLQFSARTSSKKVFAPGGRGPVLRRATPGRSTRGIEDLSSLRTRATRNGERWTINGHKVFITGGSSAGAGILLANGYPDLGKNGLTTFLVRPGMPGYSHDPSRKKLGHRVIDICQIALDALELTDERRVLGAVGSRLQDHSRGPRYQSRRRSGASRRCRAKPPMTMHSLTRRSATVLANRSSSIRRSGFASPKWPPGSKLRDSCTFMLPDLRSRDMLGSRKPPMAKLFARARPLNGFAAMHCKSGGAGYLRDRWLKKLYRDQRVLQIYEGTNRVLKMLIQRAAMRST